LEHGLDEIATFCDRHGFPFDVSSAKAIQHSLSDEAFLDNLHPHLSYLLSQKLTVPMQPAEYICTGRFEEEEWSHYALAMGHYTHFTSPIRRYPDILVHRLLQKAIDVEAAGREPERVLRTRIRAMDQPTASASLHPGTAGLPELEALFVEATRARQIQLTDQCHHCNEKKSFAKKAQDASEKLFLAVMLRHRPQACMI